MKNEIYTNANLTNIEKMNALAPELMKAFWAFDKLAVAEGAIPDLVVILQEIHEGGWSKFAARLAPSLSVAVHGSFALIDEAGAQSARDVVKR